MKNWFLIAILTAVAFTSCNRLDLEANRADITKENAEKVLGITIDPNQDWNSSITGTITVVADANLYDIVKVQILTESPFMNPDSRVVAEANVQKGETVTLDYDAPNVYNRLIAACVDSKGHYYIQGFNIGQEKVSFKSGATTRAASARRASSDIDLSTIELKFNNSFLSYNALRALSDDNKYSNWKGKNWEKDRLWWVAGSVSNGWTLSNSTIYRDATPFSDEDTITLNNIFDASLGRYDNNNPKNNLQLINETSVVKLYGNHLQSNGKAPLTLCPVQLASTEAYWCDIYYYYYRTEDIPAGTSEADYIKTLPKFKAIDLNDERKAFSEASNIAVNASDVNFRRLHEYLLPFYGNASEFAEEPTEILPTLNRYGYTTNGKFYRIYNYSDGAYHYITNGGSEDDLKGAYTENVEEQLWQIFENHNDGTFMFYNIGSKKFLWCNNGRPEIKDINETLLDKYTFYITDSKINPTESRTKVYLYTFNQGKCLKSDAGKMLGIGNKSSTNQYREWTFEEYSYPAEAITDFDLPLKYFSSVYIEKPHESISAIIPEGYRIGFLIRKDNGKKTEEMGNDKRGCLYGYGELNTEINTYGQFKTAVNKYGMKSNSPRMATFTANGKTYLTFEEGADTQFSDVIIELGGYDNDVLTEAPDGTEERSNGIENNYLYDLNEIPGASYTLLFEDRSVSADYDMNDVVIRCKRISGNIVELSLVACGGMDNVKIKGINATYKKGWQLDEDEVHALFGVEKEIGSDRFVNTIVKNMTPLMGRYELPEGMTIPQFLSQIYIVNQTTGEEIRVARQGEAPTAIIMPFDFEYPLEGVRITIAYEEFLKWASDVTGHTDWYNHVVEDKVFDIQQFFK